MKINHTELEVVRGSVLSQGVAAIVNAANTTMRGGGGVDGAIHMAAGPRLLEELRRVSPRGAKTAEVVVTAAHEMPQDWIFHVARPIYRSHQPEEAARMLRACYLNCLEEAGRRGLDSIAFPSISTGAYGYPLESAAFLAVGCICKYLQDTPGTSLERVVLAMFGAAEFEAFARRMLQAEAPEKGQAHSSGA